MTVFDSRRFAPSFRVEEEATVVDDVVPFPMPTEDGVDEDAACSFNKKS